MKGKEQESKIFENKAREYQRQIRHNQLAPLNKIES